jgi:DNA-binding transcriptional LysR family regulator
MLAPLRSFLAVIEEGSLHRAAARLSLSQPALSRQMQALEHEMGGKLLERTSTGVKPTSAGHALAAKMGKILADYETSVDEVRRMLRGGSETLRIGYLGSSARDFLTPALGALREMPTRTKVKILDLTPGEQIIALRKGEIDVALTDHGGELLARDFYTRKVATIPLFAVLPANHPLSQRKELRIAELKDETFVYAPDSDVPGHARRLMQLCRKCGKFRPKFIGPCQSLSDGLSLVVNEGAVALLPAYTRHLLTTCFSMIPLSDPEATWDMVVVWQRGKPSAALKAFLDALPVLKRGTEKEERKVDAA